MKWISFKKELPPHNDDVLIWNRDEYDGQMIGIGCLSSGINYALKALGESYEKKPILKYVYLMFEMKQIPLEEILKQNFYWMLVPEGPK